MKKIAYLRMMALTIAAMVLVSCGGFKGSSSDRTGTNGSTNGTGKAPKGSFTQLQLLKTKTSLSTGF